MTVTDLVATIALLALTSVGGHVQQVAEPWRVDFDDGTLGGASEPQYVVRSRGVTDNSRLDAGITKGILKLGGKFDEEGARGSGDYVSVEWRDLNLPLTELPMLELRYQCPEGAGVLVMPTYEFLDGSTKMPYFYLPISNGEWQVTSHRLGADSSLPKKWTPRRLVSLTIWLQAAKPVAAHIDWLQLRPFTAEEQVREDEWIELMKDYTPPEPQRLREFFPFGVWAADYNPMSPEHTLGNLSRNHLNFMLDGKPLPEIVQAAEATGTKVCLRMRRANTIFREDGAEATRRWAEPLIRAYGDSPAVVGYDLGDEPKVDKLWQTVAAKKILQDLDPTRTSTVIFWGMFDVKAWNPYLLPICTDRYPLQDPPMGDLSESGLGPAAEMFTWCRNIARATNNKRHWIVMQSFGNQPWRAPTGYVRPTPSQLRLMTYASLAGGARGIIYYSYIYNRFYMLVDQWGNPRDLFVEAGQLAEQLIPVGHRLLNAIVDFDAQVASDNEDIFVGAFIDPVHQVHYLIPVNKNVTSSQQATVTLPAEWQGAGIAIYDLFGLEQASADVSQLAVAPLAPGAGRIYLVGTQPAFEAARQAIEAKRIEEILRVQQPDLSIASRYEADLSAVQQLRETARLSIQAGNLTAAEASAKQAGTALASIMKNLQPYASLHEQLVSTGQLMGEVEPAMYPDNPAVADLMAQFRDPEVTPGPAHLLPLEYGYWRLHKRWAQAFAQVTQGPQDGLSEEVGAIADEAEQLVAEVRQTLGDRAMY